MLRTAFIGVLVAGIVAAPAAAQGRQLLMPGVTYEREVQFTSRGPVAVHVMRGPKPGGLWSLKPVLSNGAILGRDRVTAMQRVVAREATAAGVNGDLFTWADGRPSGILMQSGVLASGPSHERSSTGITADGRLLVQRVQMFGTWRGIGQRRPLALNQPTRPNGISIFTPAWGPTTPAAEGVVEAVLAPLPPTVANVDLTGPVVQIAQTNGGTGIPRDGAVIVARGTGAARLAAEAPLGANVTVRLRLNPDWSDVLEAIGGGPILVRAGKPVFRHFELFSPAQLARNPRTAVGQLADGRIILVVVDGRQPGYSVGMTNFELALTLVRLGAVTASALDAGGSSTMAFDGRLLNRPSDPGGERAVSEGLFLVYSGVYVAPPTETVLAPNGDGVSETQGLSYKLVRPATVRVELVAPDRTVRTLDQGVKAPGLYRLSWNGLAANGAAEPEGRWRFSVTAVDDQQRPSTADRVFALNRTLGSLAVAPAILLAPGGALRASVTLTRPARVRATVETTTGIVVAVAARKLLPAGPRTITWSGRAGRRYVYSGRYVLRVAAANALGRAELTAPFSVRRTSRGGTRR